MTGSDLFVFTELDLEGNFESGRPFPTLSLLTPA